MQRLTSPGQLPEIITFGAARHEWLLTRTSVGPVLVSYPNSDPTGDEAFNSMRAAVEDVVESIRHAADELSAHRGDRIGSGYLYAEADDVEASVDELCDGDPLPGPDAAVAEVARLQGAVVELVDAANAGNVAARGKVRQLQDVLDEHVAQVKAERESAYRSAPFGVDPAALARRAAARIPFGVDPDAWHDADTDNDRSDQ